MSHQNVHVEERKLKTLSWESSMLDLCLDAGLFIFGMIVGATINTLRYQPTIKDTYLTDDELEDMLKDLEEVGEIGK